MFKRFQRIIHEVNVFNMSSEVKGSKCKPNLDNAKILGVYFDPQAPI